MNGMASAVNSTAVVSNVQPSYNGTVLRCSEFTDLSMFSEALLRVAGKVTAYIIMHTQCIVYACVEYDVTYTSCVHIHIM